MKRILRLSTLAGTIVAAAWLASLAPVSQREANAAPLYRAWNGGYYYGGGYAPAYRGYSGYGYGPYGYGGYTYAAPRGYIVPPYDPYGFRSGFGPGPTYNGLYVPTYSHSLFYPDRPLYRPYGYGAYGPYSVYVN
jgi:hypothetical protein